MKEHTSLWLMPVKHSSPAAPLMETQVRIIIRVPDWWGWLLSYFKYGKFSGSDCSLFVYFFGIQCKQKGADHPPCSWAFWYIRKTCEGICLCSLLISHLLTQYSAFINLTYSIFANVFFVYSRTGTGESRIEGRILAGFYILQVDNSVTWDCFPLGESSSCLVGHKTRLQSGPRKTEFAHPCSRKRTLKRIVRMSPHMSVQSNVSEYNGINLNSRLVCKYYSCLVVVSWSCFAPLVTHSCFCMLVFCLFWGELDKKMSHIWILLLFFFCSCCCFAIFPLFKINARQVTETTSYWLIFFYRQRKWLHF